MSVHPFLRDRWGERDYSSFSPRWFSIHQGHSCVWIMSEVRSKYLSMTSCLDWCSCAIWCFMYHSVDCLAASLAGEGLPCQSLWNTKKEKGLFRAGKKKNAMQPKMSLWLWVVLMKCLTEVIHLIWCRFKGGKKTCPFRQVDQFWVYITGRLKARDWYHVNPTQLHAPNNPSAEVKFYTKASCH